MPAPNATQLQELARASFRSFGLEMPENWAETREEFGDSMNDFPQSERNATPDPTALFLCKSTLNYHVKIQKQMSDGVGKYIDGICKAIAQAWQMWQSTATITGAIVNGPTVVGGVCVGPPWMPVIMAAGPKKNASETAYTTAIATAISNGWMAYQATWVFPGLPMYPAFTLLPPPLAPPTPNVPFPIIALTQVTTSISKNALAAQMKGVFSGLSMAANGTSKGPHSDQIFEAVADAFEKSFVPWQASTMVTNMLGTGPIPFFGPVVGGVANMLPGGLV